MLRFALSAAFLSMSLAACVQQSPPEVPPIQLSTTQVGVESASLTYGAIKKYLKVGVTTQADILKLFGSPNNMTITSDGTEMWVYDKVRTEMATAGSSGSSGGFLGGGVIVGDGVIGGGVGGSSRTSTSKLVSSTRTLTVILEFDKQSVLKEFSAREGRY
ncbi:MAG: hypothetical protein IIC54_11290 [Proteobacteria bacterium]|nr:hypothetical protein [Pseudomonadota bacterium]